MSTLGNVLAQGLRDSTPDPIPTKAAVVTLDAGEIGAWSVEIGTTTMRLLSEPHPEPDTTIRASETVLRGVVTGRHSGIGEFLNGHLTVRGDLHLAMGLDGIFVERAERPVHWPRSKAIAHQGMTTAYLEAGPKDAPTVVMLHGLGATNASLLPLIWDLATEFHVIAPDMIGFGASSKPRQRYNARAFQRWCESFLDALHHGPAHFVGNSLGGRVSLEMAMVDPSRVLSLSLLCPSPAFRKMRQLAPVVKLLRPELFAVGLPIGHRLVVEGIRAMFSQPDRLPKPWYDAAADEFARVARSTSARIAFGSALREIYLEQPDGDRGFYTRLHSLDVPSLFIWGDRDRLVPSGFARHVSEAVPSAKSVVLEDSGHVPQFEHRKQTTELVREMLTSTG